MGFNKKSKKHFPRGWLSRSRYIIVHHVKRKINHPLKKNFEKTHTYITNRVVVFTRIFVRNTLAPRFACFGIRTARVVVASLRGCGCESSLLIFVCILSVCTWFSARPTLKLFGALFSHAVLSRAAPKSCVSPSSSLSRIPSEAPRLEAHTRVADVSVAAESTPVITGAAWVSKSDQQRGHAMRKMNEIPRMNRMIGGKARVDVTRSLDEACWFFWHLRTWALSTVNFFATSFSIPSL